MARNRIYTELAPVRRMLKWVVPEVGTVEMYINPQSISINKSKNIKHERTKGGFIIQYWGEELIDITITGHTGTSGIEGINVLENVYRAEQVAFDMIALEYAARAQDEDADFFSMLMPGLDDVVDMMTSFGKESPPDSGLDIPPPTLAQLAANVEMYWMGEIYRGYFTSFNVREGVDLLGLFPYDLKFLATQKRGIRRNYFPWHHSPIGPSDHDSVPFTYARG